MRRHPREIIVSEAETKLASTVVETMSHYKLTGGEYLSVLTEVFSRLFLNFLKYEIRRERHGNTDTPGGLLDES